MLLESQYRVIVIAPVDEYVSQLAQVKNLEIVPMREMLRNSTGIIGNLLLMIGYYRHYRRYKPDLIIHYTIKPNIFGNLAAALLGIPSVCVLTGLGYTFLHKGWLQVLTGWLYRFSFRFARTVMFENQEDCDMLVAKGMVSAQKTVVVNGCGVDVQHFYPNGQWPNPEKMVFTFIGRLLIDKGIQEFVTAAKQVKEKFPRSEFWIVGGLDDDNPAHVDRSTLLQWVQSGVIQYKGFTSDIRPYIAQSDWIVLPSYREGLSRVLLEAMAMAKPLITSDTAGCRETVDEGKNGFLTPVKNGPALAGVMEHCCALSPEQIHQMGRYSRIKVEQAFESKLVAAVYRKVVRDIL